MRRMIDWFLMKPRPEARQRSMPRWMRRTLLMTVAGAMVAVYLGGIAVLTRSGWIDARLAELTEALSLRVADAGFRVRSVRVHGVAMTKTAALRKAIGIRQGDAIFDLDTRAAQRRVERLPWVRVATVERSLPDTVVVRVVEREPLALWQHEDEVALLDSTGVVVPGAPLAAFSDLPLLAGDGVPEAAPQLMAMIRKNADLAPRVTAASYVERRRWNLLLDDRVWVKLPQEKALEAWLRLADEDQEHGLLRRNILAVDVRNAENWVFRLPPGARIRMALEQNGG